MPQSRFHIGAVKTQHKTKDLHPEYYTELNMYVLVSMHNSYSLYNMSCEYGYQTVQ